jgi:hypothetical protein
VLDSQIATRFARALFPALYLGMSHVELEGNCYPCILGNDHGVLKIRSSKELKRCIHGFESAERVYIKEGHNEALRPKFLLTSDGLFREFVPLVETRGWSKYIAWLVDLSCLRCSVRVTTDFTSKQLGALIKGNITKLDRHFSGAMRLYKALAAQSNEVPLSKNQIYEIIQKV